MILILFLFIISTYNTQSIISIYDTLSPQKNLTMHVSQPTPIGLLYISVFGFLCLLGIMHSVSKLYRELHPETYPFIEDGIPYHQVDDKAFRIWIRESLHLSDNCDVGIFKDDADQLTEIRILFNHKDRPILEKGFTEIDQIQGQGVHNTIILNENVVIPISNRVESYSSPGYTG